MRILIDANLPRSLVGLFREFGHYSVDFRDIGLGNSPDSEIAAYARQNSLCLITRDYDFSDIRIYPPREYAGLVVLDVGPIATYHEILKLTRELLEQSQIVDGIPGLLAIVEPGRIRLRLSESPVDQLFPAPPQTPVPSLLPIQTWLIQLKASGAGDGGADLQAKDTIEDTGETIIRKMCSAGGDRCGSDSRFLVSWRWRG